VCGKPGDSQKLDVLNHRLYNKPMAKKIDKPPVVIPKVEKKKLDFSGYYRKVEKLLDLKNNTEITGWAMNQIKTTAEEFLKGGKGAETTAKNRIEVLYTKKKIPESLYKEIYNALVMAKEDMGGAETGKTPELETKTEEDDSGKKDAQEDKSNAEITTTNTITSMANPMVINSHTDHPDIVNHFEENKDLSKATPKELLDIGYGVDSPEYRSAITREKLLAQPPENKGLKVAELLLQGQVYSLVERFKKELEERFRGAKGDKLKEGTKKLEIFLEDPYRNLFYTKKKLVEKADSNNKFLEKDRQEFEMLSKALKEGIPLKLESVKIGRGILLERGKVIDTPLLVKKINLYKKISGTKWEVVSVFERGSESFLSLMNDGGEIKEINRKVISEMADDVQTMIEKNVSDVRSIFENGGPKPGSTILTIDKEKGTTMKYNVIGNENGFLSFDINDGEGKNILSFGEVIKSINKPQLTVAFIEAKKGKEAHKKVSDEKEINKNLDAENEMKREKLYLERFKLLPQEISELSEEIENLQTNNDQDGANKAIEELKAKYAELEKVSKELFPLEYSLIHRITDENARKAIDRYSDKENISLFGRELESDGKTMKMVHEVSPNENGMIAVYSLSGFSIRLAKGEHKKKNSLYTVVDHMGNTLGTFTYNKALSMMERISKGYEEKVKNELEEKVAEVKEEPKGEPSVDEEKKPEKKKTTEAKKPSKEKLMAERARLVEKVAELEQENEKIKSGELPITMPKEWYSGVKESTTETKSLNEKLRAISLALSQREKGRGEAETEIVEPETDGAVVREIVEDSLTELNPEEKDAVDQNFKAEESPKINKISWLAKKIGDIGSFIKNKDFSKAIEKMRKNFLKTGLIVVLSMIPHKSPERTTQNDNKESDNSKEIQLNPKEEIEKINAQTLDVTGFDNKIDTIYNSLSEDSKKIYLYHRGLESKSIQPYVIVDVPKDTAYVFDSSNKLVHSFPALINHTEGAGQNSSKDTVKEASLATRKKYKIDRQKGKILGIYDPSKESSGVSWNLISVSKENYEAYITPTFKKSEEVVFITPFK
jgi:hypothetical protein